jgi:two-component system, chemotaxis family, chemotaxis protein CheY
MEVQAMLKILIVDDSSTARMFIRRCLEIAGCQGADFQEAGNGKEALDLLRDAPVDFLLVDLNMPVLDGRNLLKRLKENPGICDIPVVIVSSASNPASDIELIAEGAYAVLSKPITPPALIASIGALFKKQEAAHGPA